MSSEYIKPTNTKRATATAGPMAGNIIEVNAQLTGQTGGDRQRRYRATAKGKATEKRYRHDNSKWVSDSKYLARNFCAIDGEGISLPDGTHIYTLLAYRDGDVFDSIANEYGLASVAVFDFLLRLAETQSIKVIYGGSYDFNMWVSDLPEETLKRLYADGSAIWNGYRLSWQRGKAFRIAPYPRGKSVTIYDCVSFFQRPFVQACDEYLGDSWHAREMIVRNKGMRNQFTAADAREIAAYNEAELIVLQDLMTELRARLNKVGLRPKRWDGPGAIASALLARENIKSAIGTVPDDVARAARYAYAGGRFEPVRYGAVDKAAWQYDINSAYPAAIRHLPDLSNGVWTHDATDTYADYALYHIEYDGSYSDIPGALFRRDKNGSVCYPLHVTGWYWSPEYAAAKEYCAAGYGTMRVLERWVYHGSGKPFEFVEPLYNKRRALKESGDGAHVGLKLALNSIYGKLCQQVGWRLVNGELRIPPYHCLPWAGYITSYCRAQILRAITIDPESIVAIETDAVFTSRELPLDIGSQLGQWERSQYRSLTYVQSGMYFADGKGGKAKTRGIDRGNLNESDIRVVMFSDNPYVTVGLRRFNGLGTSLKRGLSMWRRWVDLEKTITLHPTGKRVHSPLCTCAHGEWHLTLCPMLNRAHSHEFPIEWINPNPDMTELTDMRTTEWEYD